MIYLVLFMIPLQAQVVETIRDTSKFCYTRAEAEKIYTCLKVKSQMEIDLINKTDPVISDESFLSKNSGSVLFVCGLLAGALLADISHPK